MSTASRFNDAGDFSHALRSRKDNKASISIIRDKKEQTITLTLPERQEPELFHESFDVEIPEIDAETREIWPNRKPKSLASSQRWKRRSIEDSARPDPRLSAKPGKHKDAPI